MSQVKSSKRIVHSAAIAEQIEKEIVDGSLVAGEKLDETVIAERFGVSRTPVREALMTLASRAMVERVPYKGVVVCDLSIERIESMFEAMSEIEGTCGRLAAGRMTTSERADLREFHFTMADLVQKGRFEDYQQANGIFHDMIYRGTHNNDLIDIASGIRMKLAPFRRSQLLNHERVQQSHKEHEEIVTALMDRDAISAERLLRYHLVRSAKAYISALSARTKNDDNSFLDEKISAFQ